MKKLFPVLLLLVVAFSGCRSEHKWVELEKLPKTYRLEDAKADDCVVYENLNITSGQSEWDSFVKKTKKGVKAKVRLAFYYNLNESETEIKVANGVLYMNDLEYDGEKYQVIYTDQGQKVTKEYQYMVRYEGQPRSRSAIYKRYIRYVLVDDDTVTWDDIERGMYSSQADAGIKHYVVYYYYE